MGSADPDLWEGNGAARASWMLIKTLKTWGMHFPGGIKKHLLTLSLLSLRWCADQCKGNCLRDPLLSKKTGEGMHTHGHGHKDVSLRIPKDRSVKPPSTARDSPVSQSDSPVPLPPDRQLVGAWRPSHSLPLARSWAESLRWVRILPPHNKTHCSNRLTVNSQERD